MLSNLRAWWTHNARQTSTITGLATLAMCLCGVGTGTMTTPVAINLAVGAVVAILLPGHEDAQKAASKAANDAIAMLDSTQRIRAIADLQQDLPQAVEAVVRAQREPA